MDHAIHWMLHYRIQFTHDGAHRGTYHLYLDTFQYVYRDLIGTCIQGPYRDLLDYTDARRLPIYIFRNNLLYLYTWWMCLLTSLSELCWWSSIFDNITNLPCFTLITKELYWCFRDTNKERELWSHSNDRRLISMIITVSFGLYDE